jgi:hypothetical protein
MRSCAGHLFFPRYSADQPTVSALPALMVFWKTKVVYKHYCAQK